MSLFNFFKKQPPAPLNASETPREQTNPNEPNDTTPTPLSEAQDFVQSLVDFFKSRPAVNAAYFGFLHNKQTSRNHLFLVVEHDDDVQFIMQKTWDIKSTCAPATELHFASSGHDQNLADAVKETNFPFYEREGSNEVQQLIMKRFFDAGRYEALLIEAAKRGVLFTLTHDIEPTANVLNFPSYKRTSGEFIPLFSSMEMIQKSGMKKIPDNYSVIKFEYRKLNQVLNFDLREQPFVLNPGSPFELEFHA